MLDVDIAPVVDVAEGPAVVYLRELVLEGEDIAAACRIELTVNGDIFNFPA